MADPVSAGIAALSIPITLYNARAVFKSLRPDLDVSVLETAYEKASQKIPRYRTVNGYPESVRDQHTPTKYKLWDSTFDDLDKTTTVDFETLKELYETSFICDVHRGIDLDASKYQDKSNHDFKFEKLWTKLTRYSMVDRGINSFHSTKKLYSTLQSLRSIFGYNIDIVILAEYIHGSENKSHSEKGLVSAYTTFARLFELFVSQRTKPSNYICGPTVFELLNIPDILSSNTSYVFKDYIEVVAHEGYRISALHQSLAALLKGNSIRVPNSENLIDKLIWHYVVGKRLIMFGLEQSDKSLIFDNIPLFSSLIRRPLDIGITHLLVQEWNIIYIETALNSHKERLDELKMFKNMHDNGYSIEELIQNNAVSYLPLLALSGMTYYPWSTSFQEKVFDVKDIIRPVKLANTYYMTTIFTRFTTDNRIFAISIHEVMHHCLSSDVKYVDAYSLLRECEIDPKTRLVSISPFCMEIAPGDVTWSEHQESRYRFITDPEQDYYIQ